MILHTQPNKPWSEHDFLLLEAYQITEDERCPQCGMYRWICDNESNDIQFDVREEYCAAKAVVDKRRRDDGKKANHEDPLGTIMKPVPRIVSGAELVSFREPYYKAQAAKREALAALEAES